MFMKLDWRFLKNLESRGVWYVILGRWTNDTNEAMYARVGEAPVNRVFEKFCYIEPKASGHRKNAIVRSRQQVQELVSSK